MFTLGYSFRPWTEAKAIADGPAILDYVRDTAREHGVDQHIRFGHQRRRAPTWSTRRRALDRRRRSAPTRARRCSSPATSCSAARGYYRYDEGYTPDFAGRERFSGEIVHPQHWPEDLDYAGKRVVVIGSGATAVTLVPAMAGDGRARDDAAALADATSSRCPAEDPIANASCAACCRRRPPTRSCAGRTC